MFQVFPPVLELRKGATHRDLHMGTYAFWGATPGDLRGLAALGAGRRPAASNFNSEIHLCLRSTTLTEYISGAHCLQHNDKAKKSLVFA